MRLQMIRTRRAVLAAVFSLFLVNAFVLTSSAQNQSILPPGDLNCKWSGEDCENGTPREVCLEDGDGNACTCGSVSRPCS